jgi:hypothetical protein
LHRQVAGSATRPQFEVPVPACTGVGWGTPGDGGTPCEKHRRAPLGASLQQRYGTPSGACHPVGQSPHDGGGSTGHGVGGGQSQGGHSWPSSHAAHAQSVSPHSGGEGAGGQLGVGPQSQGGQSCPSSHAGHPQPTGTAHDVPVESEHVVAPVGSVAQHVPIDAPSG